VYKAVARHATLLREAGITSNAFSTTQQQAKFLTFDIDRSLIVTLRKMSSYYDVDAILTDAQKVPCTFELTVPGLGYLEGNMSGDMKQGSKVELPLWLGEMLALR
jgi:hypothetical protein